MKTMNEVYNHINRLITEKEWDANYGGPAIADAACDRINKLCALKDALLMGDMAPDEVYNKI